MILFAACSKSDEGTPLSEGNAIVKNSIGGKIEKGPFLTGSKITLYELNKDLKQTGKNIFKTETTNDNGDFFFDSKMELSSPFVEFEINGYFYNEVTGLRSNSQITLNALADITNKNKVNVNILTHLEFKRIKKLVTDGLSFSNAQKQAQQELLKVFHINKEVKNSEDIGLTDGTEDAAVLLAISSILLYDKREAEFSEFLAKISNEFVENGTITNQELLDKIHDGETNVDAIGVMDNLKNYFSKQNKTIVIENIRKYIDGNGDGVLDEKDENLDKKPGEVLTPDDHFNSENDFKAVLSACHAKIRRYYEQILVLDAIRCQQIKPNSRDTIIVSSNSIVSAAWSNAYQSIRNLNLIIDKGASIISFDAKPYISTAKVLRSLMYLDMAQHWGDVPFITHVPDNSFEMVPRTLKNEIYSSIISDLNDVIPYLLNETDHNQLFVSTDLANAIIANVFLEQKNYTSAITYLDKIITNNKSISLDNDVYSDISNKESLFALLYNDNSTEQPFPLFRDYLKKGNLHPIIRYSGIVLNYAEALSNIGKTTEALNALNQVRIAKGLPSITEPIDNLKKEIATLWKSSFGTDYGYFALLKRLDLAVELLKIQDYQQLYPIPQNEVYVNPSMVQNPGY